MTTTDPKLIDCPQISMGHGKVDVGIILHEGRKGLIFHPRESYIPVGAPGETAGDYWPQPEDVIIWIDAPEGADVIVREIAPLATAPVTTDPKLIEPVAWECFCDRSYFDTWCVRQVGKMQVFGAGFHLVNEDEAQVLCNMLNSTEAAINEAAQNERAGIVAWLRNHKAFSHIGGGFMADAIERGEHLPSPPAIEAHKESQHG